MWKRPQIGRLAACFGTAATLAASGCAPTRWAPTPSASILDFNVQSARCRLMARGAEQDFVAYGNANYVAGAALGNAIGNIIRIQAAYSDCMQANGWEPLAAQ